LVERRRETGAATGAGAGAATTGAEAATGAASAETFFLATRLGAGALIIPEEEEIELILKRGNTLFCGFQESIFIFFCVFYYFFLSGFIFLTFFFEIMIL
jgi:hypothetical protein